MVLFPFYRKRRIMKPIKILELSEVNRLKSEKGYLIMAILTAFISDEYIKYLNQLPFLR